MAAQIAAVELEVADDSSACEDIGPDAGTGFKATPTVRVTGTHAVARFSGFTQPSGYHPDPRSFRLVKSDAGWQVDDPPRPHFAVLSAGDKRCMASWNHAVSSHRLAARPSRGAVSAEQLWATVHGPSRRAKHCSMVVNIPNALLVFDDRDGRWRRAIRTVRGLASRNVWMRSDSTVVALDQRG